MGSSMSHEVRRIAIIDSDPLALRCLIDFIGSHQNGISVGATFRDGAEAVESLAPRHGTSCHRESCGAPAIDGIICDMSPIGTTGPLICRHLRRGDATTPILGMAKSRTAHYAAILSLCGGQGLVPKEDPESIVTAVDALMSGRPAAFPGFEDAATAHTRLAVAAAARMSLPPRVEELAAVITGDSLSPNEAADLLHIAPSTARGYLKQIRDHYHVDDTTSALRLWMDDNTVGLR